MKVLAVTPLYPPSSRVGAWLATHQLMRQLVAAGHEATSVALSAHGKGWELDGVKVETGRRGRTHVSTIADRHDVVISHYGDGGQGATIARRANRPSVQMVHGWIRKAPASADLLVFNTESNRACCSLGDTPSIVCLPPVPFEDFVTTPGDCVTIVNCSEMKGIRTAWRCAERLPKLQFLGVRGGYGQQITPRADNFETVGTTPHMRDDVFARTRILLMPSEHETYGMAGVEAMCSGIPVIAHPTPGLVEALGDAGIFVDRGDVDGWVAEIERLRNPAEYLAAGRKALARVEQLKVETAAGVARFVEALEDLCESSSASRSEMAAALTALQRHSGLPVTAGVAE
jgi:glycosyltransferase involved in cell wall biosynthesis